MQLAKAARSLAARGLVHGSPPSSFSRPRDPSLSCVWKEPSCRSPSSLESSDLASARHQPAIKLAIKSRKCGASAMPVGESAKRSGSKASVTRHESPRTRSPTPRNAEQLTTPKTAILECHCKAPVQIVKEGPTQGCSGSVNFFLQRKLFEERERMWKFADPQDNGDGRGSTPRDHGSHPGPACVGGGDPQEPAVVDVRRVPGRPL